MHYKHTSYPIGYPIGYEVDRLDIQLDMKTALPGFRTLHIYEYLQVLAGDAFSRNQNLINIQAPESESIKKNWNRNQLIYLIGI